MIVYCVFSQNDDDQPDTLRAVRLDHETAESDCEPYNHWYVREWDTERPALPE